MDLIRQSNKMGDHFIVVLSSGVLAIFILMRPLYFSFLVVLLLASSYGQTVRQTHRLERCSTQVPKVVPTISFCELLRNPARYHGTIVRLKVKYLVGGETAVVYDKNCEGEAWIQFDHVFNACTKKSVRDRLNQRDSPPKTLFDGLWESEIVAVGMFVHDLRGSGHLGAYKYQFTIKWVEEVRVMPKKVA